MINHADQSHTITAAKLPTPVAEWRRQVLQTRPEDTTHEENKSIRIIKPTRYTNFSNLILE